LPAPFDKTIISLVLGGADIPVVFNRIILTNDRHGGAVSLKYG
jgi:hypothetical protein